MTPPKPRRVVGMIAAGRSIDELAGSLTRAAREYADLAWSIEGRSVVLYVPVDDRLPATPTAKRGRSGKVSAAGRSAPSHLLTPPAPEGKRASVTPAPRATPMAPAPALVCDWCARTDFHSRIELGTHREKEHPISRTPFQNLATRIDSANVVAGPRSPFG